MKVLILHNRNERLVPYSVTPLQEAFTKLGTDVEVAHVSETMLQWHSQTALNQTVTQPKFFIQGKERSFPDVVLGRVIGDDIAGRSLLYGFSAAGATVVNDPSAAHAVSDKTFTGITLAHAGIPTVPSTFHPSPFHSLPEVQLPVVAKPVKGMGGKNVICLKTKEDLHAYRQNENHNGIIVQPAYLNTREVRAFVVDGEVVACMLKTPSPNDFRKNMSKGAEVEACSVTPLEGQLAVESTRVCGLMFSGVDLIEDCEGNMRVLEVNANPGFNVAHVAKVDVPYLIAQKVVLFQENGGRNRL